MSFKRNPETYPLLNGQWLDKFAEDLMKKQAAPAPAPSTGAPVPPAPTPPTPPTGAPAPATPPATGGPTPNPYGGPTPGDKQQTYLQVAREIINNVQNRGVDFEAAMNDAQSRYPSFSQSAWAWIRSYAAQQTSRLDPSLGDPNTFAQMIINDLRTRGVSITPSEVTNAINGLTATYPAIASNENFKQQIRQIVESQFASTNNTDQIAQNFQRYVQENSIQNPTETELDSYLASVGVQLLPQEKSQVLQAVLGRRDSTDIDSLVGLAFEDYRRNQGTLTPDVVVDNLVRTRGLTQEQRSEVLNRLNQMLTRVQGNSEIQRLSDEVAFQALAAFSGNPSLSSDGAVGEAIQNLQTPGASLENITDSVYLQELQTIAISIFEGKIQKLKDMVPQIAQSAQRDGKDVNVLIDSLNSLNAQEKAALKALVSDNSALSGTFNDKVFRAELQSIARELNGISSASANVRDTLINGLKNKRDITKEQQNAMIKSFENFIASINGMASGITSMAAGGTGTPATTPGIPSSTASGKDRVLTAAGGLSGMFQNLWYGKESSPEDYASIVANISGMAHAVAAGMGRFNNLNDMLNRPDTPPVYKQNFQSVISSFQSVQNSINNLGSTFGFQPPTISGMQQVLENAKKASEQGAPSVDSLTGRPEQGQGQQVPPEQLVNALQGQGGVAGAQDQKIDRSTLNRPQPLPTGQEEPQDVLYDLQRSIFEFELRVKLHMQKNRKDLTALDPALPSKMNRILGYLQEMKKVLDEQTVAAPDSGAPATGAPPTGTPPTGAPAPAAGPTASKKDWIKV